MRLATATLVGATLLVSSSMLLLVANQATDATAIAGGTGVVLAGALLGLTLLARFWRNAAASYMLTDMDQHGVYAELASAFEDDVDVTGFEDAAAV